MSKILVVDHGDDLEALKKAIALHDDVYAKIPGVTVIVTSQSKLDIEEELNSIYVPCEAVTMTSDPEHIAQFIKACVVKNVSAPILMSRDNPHGYTLEQITYKLTTELTSKRSYLNGDRSLVAVGLSRNNEKIVKLLKQVDALNKESMDMLDDMAVNVGPTSPRIGVVKHG